MTARYAAILLLGLALATPAVAGQWAAFYKDRNKGDDYVLIRMTPTRLEIVSEALGMRNDPETWRPVVLELP